MTCVIQRREKIRLTLSRSALCGPNADVWSGTPRPVIAGLRTSIACFQLRNLIWAEFAQEFRISFVFSIINRCTPVQDGKTGSPCGTCPCPVGCSPEEFVLNSTMWTVPEALTARSTAEGTGRQASGRERRMSLCDFPTSNPGASRGFDPDLPSVAASRPRWYKTPIASHHRRQSVYIRLLRLPSVTLLKERT
jgi:hypothetical protein